MTTLPNDLVVTVNHERSPVILADADAQDRWVRGAAVEAFALVQSPPAGSLVIVREGFEKTDGQWIRL